MDTELCRWYYGIWWQDESSKFLPHIGIDGMERQRPAGFIGVRLASANAGFPSRRRQSGKALSFRRPGGGFSVENSFLQ
jgi:hypothetical protein